PSPSPLFPYTTLFRSSLPMISEKIARARVASLAAVMAFLGMLNSAGCGPSGPKTYPVRGRVEVAGGDVRHLAGANIEAALESDRSEEHTSELQSLTNL